jgi:hypothetical protein
VAAFTNCEIIAAERALAIMTSHATLGPTRRVMVERFRRRYLPALRHPCAHLMTFIASQLLMLRMVEADLECRRQLRRARIRT